MEMKYEIYGAYACIDIRFSGTLELLAANLAKALNLKPLLIEHREHSPHELMGSGEALGWEFWLQGAEGGVSGCFTLRMETEHSIEEVFHGRMYDLSPWLARLVTTTCDVEARPARRDVPT
jgi:hypothetical protein